ncbi:histidine kinase [Lysinibacillus telephonicus]|uniref:Histidine kinase n=1 Tax=Lysinibacillus telephonicus TaxID=1714840 RepID=A0A3S0JXW0_9BACI|nr:histidine kinase [Lysinibacillus telephonicus]RTQ94138.1 histidine kinase [Lysinibacillus telephonicus]
MKKLVIFNVLFCILVIFVSNYYYNSKSKKAVAYFYAENNIETNYGVDRENLIPKEINYLPGIGLFEIEVIDKDTENIYFFEVDIRDDFSLFYIKDLTDIHNENIREING